MLSHTEYMVQRQATISGAIQKLAWSELIFLHGTAEPEEIQKLLPGGLSVDTMPDARGVEKAWIGYTFWAQKRRGLGFGKKTLLSGLRTYVHSNGHAPGVWHFSIETTSFAEAARARIQSGLPMHYAAMKATRGSGGITYSSERSNGTQTDFFGLKILEEPKPPEPGSPAFFFTERLIRYAQKDGVLRSIRLLHPPMLLSPMSPHFRLQETIVQSELGIHVAFFHAMHCAEIDVLMGE